MKKLILILIILNLLSCNKDDNFDDNQVENLDDNSGDNFDDDQIEITELQHDTLIIYQKENITVKLIDINEGRCPINVDCAWQGNTTVEMNITNGIEATNFILNSAGFINDDFNFQNSITIYDLHIELLDVQPYPEEENTKILLEDYIVNLSVN